MPRRVHIRSLAAFCVIMLAIAVVPVAVAQTPVPASALEWSPCPAPFPVSASPVVGVADFPPGLECASLEVPLDYGEPDGKTITIGLNRLAALDPSKRVGSLVFNPGGPGGAGTEVVAVEALGIPIFTPAVREHFDLIGMDPRGVGTSTRVRCDPDLWNEPVPLFPDDEAEFARLREHARALGESCLRLTGPLLGHVDTTSAARDLEAVRAALGEGDLNFLGLSYGSQLGVAYAELFPENIRVMALDGALDHGRHLSETLIGEATAYETVFERFAQWCAETPDCALHGKDVGTFFDDLVERADARPIPAPLCQESGRCRATVTGEDIRLSLQGLILFKEPLPSLRISGWPGAAEALMEAAAGDASKLSIPVATGEDAGAYAELAIACADWPNPNERYEDLAAKELLGRVIAPHTRGASQTWRLMTGCLDWPVPVANPPHRAEVSGAPPILIVNSTYDLSTPYIWAHALRDQVEGSVMLTREGDGHTTYLQPGPSQTRDAIDTYLVTGETPPPNTVYDS